MLLYMNPNPMVTVIIQTVNDVVIQEVQIGQRQAKCINSNIRH